MPDLPILRPSNWSEFQHYKERDPSWIKLHVRILDNYEFSRLPVSSRALAPMLWLLASQFKDAQMPFDKNKLAWRLHMTPEEFEESIKPLIDKGFFIVEQVDSALLAGCYQTASNSLADGYQNASLEKEIEREKEVEEEKESSRAKRAARIADDWTPSMADREFAASLGLDVDRVASAFLDYWRGASGQNARKHDWSATWRNWCRRDAERIAPQAKTRMQSTRRQDEFDANQARIAELLGSQAPSNYQGQTIDGGAI